MLTLIHQSSLRLSLRIQSLYLAEMLKSINESFIISSYCLFRETGESGEGSCIENSDIKFTNREHNVIESYCNPKSNTDTENDN